MKKQVTDSHTVNVDKDYKLINEIQRSLINLQDDEIVIQVITSPCFTQALIIYKCFKEE